MTGRSFRQPRALLGAGPYLGLCATDPSFLISQFLAPLGTAPFHFIAPGPSVSFGPIFLPPGFVVDAITFTLGPGPSCVSPTTRLVVQ